MRKQKFGSGFGYGHRTLKVEQLEGRAMLAGNVGVTLAGGNLIITGDNQDNAVLVQEVEDENDNDPNTHAYLITGFDTSITGGGQDAEPEFGGTSARVVHGVRGNIVIDLKKGNDVLGVGNSVDDLIALAEDCGFGLGLGSGSGGGGGSGSSFPTVTAEQPVLEGRLTTPISLVINMGDGNNAVAVIGDIGVNYGAGSLVINGGKNSDNVAVGNSFQAESDSFINGDLAIVTGKGDDNICVHNATMRGAMAINAGDGFNEVSGENFAAAAATVVTGKNGDGISLTNFDLDTALTVNAGNGNNNVLIADFDAGQGDGPNDLPHGGGAVTVVTGSGHDDVGLSDFAADSVVVNTGSGNDGDGEEPVQPIGFFGPVSVHFATITGALVVTTGNGNDLVDVDTVKAAAIVVDTGAGNDGDDEGFPVEIDNCTVSGNVVLNTGSGNDFAEVLNELDEIDHESGQGIIHGSLIINLGAGNDELFLGGDDEFIDVIINGNLTVVAGSGNDFVDLAHGTIGLITTFSMGQGTDELHIFESGGGSAVAMLIADGGPGTDTFRNDLGVDSNGNFDEDANGVPHIIVRNFEFFEAPDDLLTILAKARKGW